MTFIEIVANLVHKRVEERYKLSVDPSFALSVARMIVNEIAQNNRRILNSKSTVDALYKTYFETTGLPESEYKHHSAFWFSKFMKQHFVIVVLPKNKLTFVLHKVLQKFFKPKLN